MSAYQIDVRATVAGDRPDLEALYEAAFPEEDLLPLVRRLLREEPGIFSLAATMDGRLAGHIIFTPCGVGQRDDRVALLGPLAVTPSRQRQGVGRSLIRAGFDQLAKGNFRRALVPGDPAYYDRFGFLPESSIEGILRPPAAWLQAALWSP